MKKVLFVATIARHVISFHLPYLKELVKNGYEVHVAANNNEYNYDIPFTKKIVNIPFSRQPLSKDNIKAYKMLSTLITEENYDFIHCHTPIASFLTRICNSKETKLIYTAHGFHFYKGAPLINWMIYYPIERYLAKKTDTIITINSEDYKALSKFKTSRKKMVNGVGVDALKFSPCDEKTKSNIRKTLGIEKNCKVLFFAAEFNSNKNQKFLIETIEVLKVNHPSLLLLLAGEGPKKKELMNLCKMKNIEDNVAFLGHIENIDRWLKASDIVVSSSKREGLPVNIIEGILTGLPAVVTNCRGNRDVVQNNLNGYVIEDQNDFISKIDFLLKNKREYNEMSKKSREIGEMYSIDVIKKEISKIYEEYEKIIYSEKHA